MNHYNIFKHKLRQVAMLLLSLCFVESLQAQAPAPYPTTMKVNYVRTWVAMAPEDKETVLLTRPLSDVKENTQFLDGLGRPIQTVTKEGSLPTGGTATDAVDPIFYDDMGRVTEKYLPFASATSTGAFKFDPYVQQAAFYNDPNGVLKGQDENSFYSKTIYESSPLNRVNKTMAAGKNWVGSSRGVEAKYWLNTSTDSVKVWNVTNVANNWGSYTAVGNYASGQLYKTVTIDEHGKQVIEFKDKDGKVLLKKVQMIAAADDGTGKGHYGWLCTYYIYDDLNQLRLVVQPRGVEMIAFSWNLSAAVLNEQCFRYEYDQRGRMIRKKVPGAGDIWMVYDAKDRLAMSQDANIRAKNQWMYNVYDEFNRLISTGLLNDPLNANNPTYHLNAAYGSTSYPNLSTYTFEELSNVFYDNYDWLAQYAFPLSSTYSTDFDGHFLTANNIWPYAIANIQSNKLKGKPTGNRIKVIGTSTYLYTLNIYDDKGRVIQAKSTNITGGIDMVTTQYNWAGQPLILAQVQQKNDNNAQTCTTISKITYDELGRIVKTEKKAGNTFIKSGTLPDEYKVTAMMQYDKLGQVTSKTLSPTGGQGGTPLEDQHFDYNIRGWILGMNRDFAKDANNTNYFGFDLGYDKVNNGIINNQSYAAAQYNGNIAGMLWKSRGDGEKRKYDFTYDAANRLLAADFNQFTGGSFNKTANIDFSISGLSYDANGNIKSMIQKGLKLNSSPVIDNLRYDYNLFSNKLSKVTDGVALDNGLGDFKDGVNGTAQDYAYDGNGNLTKDENKHIKSITYNHLNLPQLVTVEGKGTVAYTYDASGNKLKKVTVDNTTTTPITTTTLYLGGSVFQNDTLQFMAHEEGRIRFKSAVDALPASLHYDYMLKDHLGNVRMILTEQEQEDNYPAASMETAQSTIENLFYSNINSTRSTKPADYPADHTTSPNDYAAKTNGAGNKIGPTILLKVMAGDKFNLKVSSWYNVPQGTNVGEPSPLSELANALANGIAPASGGKASATDLITSGLTGTAATSFLNNQTVVSGKPQAFISWILLDEQFKIAKDANGNVIGSGYSGFVRVGDNNVLTMTALADMPIAKSGYLYVYVSNQTPNVDVYFDNLRIIHNRGPILEETHYYPFGLTMQGIASKAMTFGATQGKYGFNGNRFESKEFADGGELGVYDFNARTYDPQIGRFMQIDPLSDIAENYSPYLFAGNNPINANDPSGLSDTTINGEVMQKGAPLEQATVYTDSYRNKRHARLNSYTWRNWEILVMRYHSRGWDNDKIREHYRNLSPEAMKRLELGIEFEKFNRERYEATRKGDIIFLKVVVNLIPAGRVLKWGGKAVTFIATAANKPIVRQLCGEFIKQLGLEAIENHFEKVDLFDAAASTILSRFNLSVGKGVLSEAGQALIDIDLTKNLKLNPSALGFGKGLGSTLVDLGFGSMKVAADNMKGNEAGKSLYNMAVDQLNYYTNKEVDK